MNVYHVVLTGNGFVTKTDRQPSGGGAVTSPYLHDFMLNYAFYSAFNSRSMILREDPDYLNDLKDFFEKFPVYVYPTIISKGFQASETISVLSENRGISDIGNNDNVPKKNMWTGYKSFIAQTTVLSKKELPERFYIRIGKKLSPVLVNLFKIEDSRRINEEKSIGVISPLMHRELTYTSGTLWKMNPSPLYIGKAKGDLINYNIDKNTAKKIEENCNLEVRDWIYKPLNFEFLNFE